MLISPGYNLLPQRRDKRITGHYSHTCHYVWGHYQYVLLYQSDYCCIFLKSMTAYQPVEEHPHEFATVQNQTTGRRLM